MADYLSPAALEKNTLEDKIDIFDVESLKNWHKLRKIGQDFAKNHFNKHVYNTSNLFFLFWLVIIVLYAIFFSIKEVSTSVKKIMFTLKILACVLDVIIAVHYYDYVMINRGMS